MCRGVQLVGPPVTPRKRLLADLGSETRGPDEERGGLCGMYPTSVLAGYILHRPCPNRQVCAGCLCGMYPTSTLAGYILYRPLRRVQTGRSVRDVSNEHARWIHPPQTLAPCPNRQVCGMYPTSMRCPNRQVWAGCQRACRCIFHTYSRQLELFAAFRPSRP